MKSVGPDTGELFTELIKEERRHLDSDSSSAIRTGRGPTGNKVDDRNLSNSQLGDVGVLPEQIGQPGLGGRSGSVKKRRSVGRIDSRQSETIGAGHNNNDEFYVVDDQGSNHSCRAPPPFQASVTQYLPNVAKSARCHGPKLKRL